MVAPSLYSYVAVGLGPWRSDRTSHRRRKLSRAWLGRLRLGARGPIWASKRTPPTLPEIGREAPATVCAPLVVSLSWRVTARCPIVDPDLAPGRSAIPVRVAAMVLTARRLLRFLVLGLSNSILRLRRARGRDRCLARPRRIVALGAGAGGEKRRVDAARRWSGAAAESNGSDCWAIVRHPNPARLAQLDGNTVGFGPGVADAGRLVRSGLRACDDE